MHRLMVIVTSTREQRAGRAIAEWFVERARRHGTFELELVDLKELALPLLDEPIHPIKRQYQHAHTLDWSRRVAAADAFVFVVPEYNHGMPPALLNALDYLYAEWNYKAAAFVSYGGMSGGTRSVQMAVPVLTALRMMPIPDAVALPYAVRHLENGVFAPGETPEAVVPKLLAELARWTGALATLRR